MEKECKIEVLMTPHAHDNPDCPYFWCILEWDGDSKSWGNVGCGWAKTPDDAWEEANTNLAYIQIRNKNINPNLSKIMRDAVESQKITPMQEFMLSGEIKDPLEMDTE